MSESGGIESLTFQTRDNRGKSVFSYVIIWFIKIELKQVVFCFIIIEVNVIVEL